MAVREIVRNARKNDGIPKTAQQSIPFDRMFPDGICRVGLDYYTKTVQFQDINYQLAQQEDKTEIFEEWCAFLNFFDSSVKFQLSFENMATDVSDFEKSIKISHKKDGFDDVRDEYSEVLLHQMEAGNNGLTKTKYLTFGIHAESMKTAKPRLTHIETDILNNFKRLGVQARSLNGSERLEMMHRQFHMGDDAKFRFDWKYLTGSGLSVKDFIAPSSFAFPTGRYFQIGEMYGCMSFLSIDASDISDRLLADFLSMESSQIVTMHIQSVDQNEAIKTIKHTITELDRSKIEEQKKAVRAGYDMDIIPSDLATYGKDAKALLKELQSQNERMFLLTFLVMNTGKTKQELENNVFQAASIAQKHNCNLIRLDYQQEQGLMSTLPLANNLIEIQRGMTTSSTAIFVPFTTQELFQRGDEALYYGLNALSNNMIMVDRKKLKNPNALILGTPGSGKSFSAKREIANSFLVTDVPEQFQAGFSDMIDEYVHFNDSARNSIMEKMTPDYMVVGIGSKTESYKYKSEIISDETAFYTNEKKEISGICNQFLNGKTDQKLFCNEMKDRLNDYYGSRYELRNQSEAVEGRVSNMLSKLQHMYAL